MPLTIKRTNTVIAATNSVLFNGSNQYLSVARILDNKNLFYYNIDKAIFDLERVYNRGFSVEEVIDNRYENDGQPDGDPEFDEDKEVYRKFLEDPPKGLLALVDLTQSGLGGQKLEMGDIVTDHFGKTADGRVVLIDYGFTTGVAEEYYRKDSSNSYGSPPPSSIMSQDEEEDVLLRASDVRW